jgi:hypothetical protein
LRYNSLCAADATQKGYKKCSVTTTEKKKTATLDISGSSA